LCAFHTWQYEMLASPRGTCLGFAPLLEDLARRLRADYVRSVLCASRCN
jgi:hypothetical protein